MADQSLGASKTWACDINRTAIEADSVAHSHARSSPAACYPIELRTQAWHSGTDFISAGIPCQASSKVGKRQSLGTPGGK